MKVHILTYRPYLNNNIESLFCIQTVDEDSLIDALIRTIRVHPCVLVNVVCKNIEEYDFGTGTKYPLGKEAQSIYVPGHPEYQVKLRKIVTDILNHKETTLNKIRAEIEKDVKEKYEKKIQMLLKRFNEEQE